MVTKSEVETAIKVLEEHIEYLEKNQPYALVTMQSLNEANMELYGYLDGSYPVEKEYDSIEELIQNAPPAQVETIKKTFDDYLRRSGYKPLFSTEE